MCTFIVLICYLLQPGVGQDFTDVCPLLDRPPGGGDNYLQPVQVDRNIELVTRNLPPEVKKERISTLLCLDYYFNFFCRFLVLVTHAM